MLNLVRCEFQKLKRKRFIQLTIAAACLFPIPLIIAMAKDDQPFIQLFRAVVLFADLLFLPCVLGIIASMLFSPSSSFTSTHVSFCSMDTEDLALSAHLLVSKEGVLNGRTSAQAMQEATSDKNRTETFMMIQIYGKEP